MTQEAFIREKFTNDPMPEVVMHDTEAPDAEGRFALSLVERFGLVAADAGLETSTGHAQFRVLPPEDVVDRAFILSRLAFARLRSEGMMTAIPAYAELVERGKEARDAEERRRDEARAKRST